LEWTVFEWEEVGEEMRVEGSRGCGSGAGEEAASALPAPSWLALPEKVSEPVRHMTVAVLVSPAGPQPLSTTTPLPASSLGRYERPEARIEPWVEVEE
jgi:hypothetical protein